MCNNQKLIIPEVIYKQITDHAQAALPLESCGYCAGKNNSVTEFIPMTNVDQSPNHFSFDPKEQFAALKKARQKDLSLIAVYHSHPETSARLSAEDIKLFNDPAVVYVIVSLKENNPSIKGFRVYKENVSNIHIQKVNIKITQGGC